MYFGGARDGIGALWMYVCIYVCMSQISLVCYLVTLAFEAFALRLGAHD